MLPTQTIPLGPASAPLAFRTAFLADWTEALFVHYAVDPAMLRRLIPAGLQLDLRDDQAFISLVAFTQRRLRPRIGGRCAEWLSRPLAEHHFLNVRTYVRHGNEQGIYFLAEWIPNRLACLLGPALYGLPYHLGKLDYHRDDGRFNGCVKNGADQLQFRATFDMTDEPVAAQAGTIDEFLVERYTAFTNHRGRLYRFRIAHAPWKLLTAWVDVQDARLLGEVAALLKQPVAAHYSQGLRDVLISRPES